MPVSMSTAVRAWVAVAAAGALLGAGASVPASAAAAAAPDTSYLNPCVIPDNAPPTVESVTFSPSAVDVSDGPRDVTLTMQIPDAGGPGAASGVHHATVSVLAPGHSFGARLELEHGDGDAWSGTFTVPQYAGTGDWTLGPAYIFDHAGNYAAPPPDTSLTVTSAAPPETDPPSVTGLSVSRTVDASSHPGTAHVVVQTSDGEGGSGVEEVRVRVQHTNDHQVAGTLADEGDGTFAGDLRIPRWVTGTWKVKEIYLRDRAGNTRDYRYRWVRALGDTAFEVTGRNDAAAPVLRHHRVGPRRLDVRRHAASVTVTAHLLDARSGVAEVEAGIGWATGRLTRVSGTPQDGIWRGRVRISPCLRLLGHRLWVSLDARDRVGNLADELLARVRIRHQDLRPPRAAMSAHRTGPDGPVAVTFDEPVHGLDDASAVVRVYGGTATVAGSWACRDRASAAVPCRTGPVSTAKWTPDGPLPAGSTYEIVLNPTGNLGVVDLNGIPVRKPGPDDDHPLTFGIE